MDCIVYCFYDNYILLVLKYRYFTNTTYGYFKKNSYIKELVKEKQEQLAYCILRNQSKIDRIGM